VSADNWAVCPKCVKEQRSWKAVLGEPLDEGEHTLREDYEIGVTAAGDFYVSYGCHCEKCGFRWSFKRDENVFTP
jgi:hypothetical protein